jgi:tetratricopeptide (TPR) repeat protein
MRTRRIAIGLAVVTVSAVAVLFGGLLRDDGDAGAASARTIGAQQAALESGFSSGNTVSLVQDLQLRLRSHRDDVSLWSLLGLAYEQRARETGDPAWYPKAGGALARALALDSHDPVATSGLASLQLSRHRFRNALELGRRARALAPDSARNLGIVGDALVELGRYPAAFAAFDRMVQAKPSLASYARYSYARELRGDRTGAIRWMTVAVDAAGAQPEPRAWAQVQLGKLYWNSGRGERAAVEYSRALQVFPRYVYALDGLAQVWAARGQLDRAIALEREAVESIPLPQFVGTLGDLYRVARRPAPAQEQYATITAIERLLRANGVRTDLEATLFDVDHGVALSSVASRARRARIDRPSIDGDDVLAWALARTGRCTEARAYSKRALRLGTKDASKYFHRGMIERCLGRPGAARAWFARALATNPHFSLIWAPVARKALR